LKAPDRKKNEKKVKTMRANTLSLLSLFLLLLLSEKKNSNDKRTKSHNDYIQKKNISIFFLIVLFKDIKKKRKLFLGFKLTFQSSFCMDFSFYRKKIALPLFLKFFPPDFLVLEY